MWAVRGALALSILSPGLNQDYANWLSPAPEPVAQAFSQSAEPFEPLAVEAPFYYDESPPGSYDFTLIDPVTDSVLVAVPSPCRGTVIDVGYDAGGYGHFVDVYCEDGYEFFMGHFSEVWVAKGQAINKGTPLAMQGSTGSSTGPHVHAEVTPPDGDRTNRAKTEPKMEEALAFWKAGASPVAPLASAAAPLLSDTEIQKAIGAAEGTVDWHTLKPDADYLGHDDPCVLNGTCPGRGINKGYFSSDYGSTPEEANAYQLAKLRAAEEAIQADAVAKFGQPLSKAAIAVALDLWNQSELAGYDLVKLLPTHDPTPAQLTEARAQTYIDPATGRLDAPGLGNTWSAVVVDQERRVGAALHALEKLEQNK